MSLSQTATVGPAHAARHTAVITASHPRRPTIIPVVDRRSVHASSSLRARDRRVAHSTCAKLPASMNVCQETRWAERAARGKQQAPSRDAPNNPGWSVVYSSAGGAFTAGPSGKGGEEATAW